MAGDKVYVKCGVYPLGESLGTKIRMEIGSSGGFSGGIFDGKLEVHNQV